MKKTNAQIKQKIKELNQMIKYCSNQRVDIGIERREQELPPPSIEIRARKINISQELYEQQRNALMWVLGEYESWILPETTK